ncbi:chaplin family protein [Streptomyces lydicus]|uniref:chaplin family protein n=1 Tax=Streptomyces lydicus TaxID=47763 RepID=UPI0039A64F21
MNGSAAPSRSAPRCCRPRRLVLRGAHADGRATNSPGIGSGNRRHRLRLSGPG